MPSLILDLYVVRHGHSWGQTAVDGLALWRVPLHERPAGCETGRMEDDWRLTPLGQQQAALLGESLAGMQFDLIFHSPLERARATAAAVETRQAKRVPMHSLHDLLEIGDYGEETPEEIYARGRRAAAAIRAQSPEGARALVAAHAMFNNCLLTGLLGLPAPETLFRFEQNNTGLNRITYIREDTPPRERARLHHMNDLSHLTPEVRKSTLEN